LLRALVALALLVAKAIAPKGRPAQAPKAHSRAGP
jgi:hypothetical protein